VDAEHREKLEQPNPEPVAEARSRPATWFLSAFLFLLFYVLSIGPVIKVNVHFDMSTKYPRAEEVLNTIYAPIVILMHKYPAAGRFFSWYLLDVWRITPSD
jgi:hypothetical protein